MAYNVFLGGRLTGSMGAHFQRPVGIGTSSPEEALHVVSAGNGGIEIENTSGAPSLIFDMPSNEEARILFKEDTETAGSIIFDSQGGSDNDMIFKGRGTNAEIMRLNSAGNVGIGVTDPDTPLEILNTSSQLKLSYDGSNAAAFTVGSGGDMTIVPSGGEVIIQGNLFPNNDNSRDLGSPAKRWANIYTGDLHLKNDRGDWTILEEEDYLCVINNKTGKKYKMGLIPIEEEDKE